MDDGLKIEVTAEDTDLLAKLAKAKYRFPEQQAAAFVHDALQQARARANAPEKPPGSGRRGSRANDNKAA